jgi:chemotaxis protein MotB
MNDRRLREESETEEGRKGESLWMIIYTDMISNLMIFFLMLYCLTWLGEEDKTLASASFKQAFAGESKAVENAVQEIEKGLDKDKSVEGRVREEFSNVQVSEKRITIVLPSPVLFDSGSATLKAETKTTLHDFAEIIRPLKNAVVVEGYTDDKPISTGEFASNWELSSARAFSVIKYLIEKENIGPERLSAFGYGEFRPLVANDTEEHRAVNRRIDINIIKG